MRICLLVKQVPATDKVVMDASTGTIVRTGIEMVINPLDLHAVEAAVRIKEADEAIGITVLSMGPASAVEAIREAMAMGCDDGALLSGSEFAGSDTWATAYALSQAVRHLDGCDLIVCGERAVDGETGQVGPMVAAMLNWPVLTYVSSISISGREIAVERVVESGRETVRCGLPALISVIREINEPRIPTLAGKMRARRAHVPTLSSEQIGAEPECLGLEGSPTRVVKVFYPRLTRSGVVVSAEATSLEGCVELLLQHLRGREPLGRGGD